MNIQEIIEYLGKNNPYPEYIFTEPTEKEWKSVSPLLLKHGIIPDRIMGKLGRMVWNNCIRQIKNLIENDEPYFGLCDVEGCKNEGVNGGGCWRESGYWTVCYKHSADFRKGLPQPKMKEEAIERENKRGSDGIIRE
jgi:hypothetical protein